MQRLFQAAESGNLNLLKNALKQSSKSNIVNAQNWNLLHFACIGGQQEVVRFLIQKNVNVNGRTNEGVTPLHLAAQIGNEFLLSILVEAGAVIDAKDNNDQTPLHYAVTNDSLICSRFLLDYGCNSSIFDKNGFAPLHCACETGNLDIINLLLEYNQDPNLICNKRIPLTERGTIFWTPLHIACQSGNIETIKALIQYHVNVNQPNNRGVTALHIVAQHSMEDILNLLLENNADITATDADKETPLFLAIREKISYNVEKLVSDEIVNNYNAKKDTPLHVACTLGFTDIASILLDHNSHINIPDNAGNTPLHLAVLSKKKDCVELLLEHGADIFVLNKKRQSAFSLSSGDITTLLKKQIEQSKPGTETTRVKILDRTSTSATMKKSTTMQKESTRPTSKASSRQTSRAVSRTNTRPASRTASKSQQKSTDTKSVTSLKTATSKAGKTGKTQTFNRKQIKEQNDLERQERENYMDTWMDEIVQMIDNAAANFAEEMKIVQEEIDDFNRYMENTKQDQNQDEN